MTLILCDKEQNYFISHYILYLLTFLKYLMLSIRFVYVMKYVGLLINIYVYIL